MLNWTVDPAILMQFVPRSVELDAFDGKYFVSLVAFQFLSTRVKGVSFPYHRDFEEVNLRFYVRDNAPEGSRRGVVFIKEIVPRRAIAWIARTFYSEPYVAFAMKHSVDVGSGIKVSYGWKRGGKWDQIEGHASGPFQPIRSESIEEFITEHYWGYTARKNGSCSEYQVEHPRWNVCHADSFEVDVDFVGLFGAGFADVLLRPPVSAFIADGSEVAVHSGRDRMLRRRIRPAF